MNGRQYFLCIFSTLFGALSGSAMCVAAMMGRSLYPVMIAQGYDRRMSVAAISSSGKLVIPELPVFDYRTNRL